jgi:hypothetical protein
MNHAMFDRLTRRTAFMTLGAAGLAALAGSTVTDAKSTHKSKKKQKNKQEKVKQGQEGPVEVPEVPVVDVKALCRPQTDQCIAFLTPACQGDPKCEAMIQRCCPSFGNCDPDGFFQCFSPPA